MRQTYHTKRLFIRALGPGDDLFIFELLNTEGWKKYIGDRNIQSAADARIYIQKIMNNPDIRYWVVENSGNQEPIGIISFVKRDYMEYPDFGFAFLPGYSGQGYALEASEKVLEDLSCDPLNSTILATMLPDNYPSIRLSEKLGFRFEREITTEHETLLRYSKTVR